MQVYYTDVRNNDYNCIKPYTVRHNYHVLWYAKKNNNKQTNKGKKIQKKNLLSGQKKLDINDTEIIFCILLPGRRPKILYTIKGNRSTSYKLAGT